MEPLLNDNEVKNIINLLQNSNLTQEQIANKIGISEALLSNINQGKAYIQQILLCCKEIPQNRNRFRALSFSADCKIPRRRNHSTK